MRSFNIILVLALGLASFPYFSNGEVLSASQITVGKDGTQMYSTIQEGVDAASPGDEVIVYQGIYDEQVYINTSGITVTGVDPLSTVVSPGAGNVGFVVSADDVNITAFNVTGGAVGIKAANVSGLNVTSCDLNIQTSYGMDIYASDDIVLYVDLIRNSGTAALNADSSSNLSISKTAVVSPKNGLRLENITDSSVNDVFISPSTGTGVSIRSSSKNISFSSCDIDSATSSLLFFVDGSEIISFEDGSLVNCTSTAFVVQSSADVSLVRSSVDSGSQGLHIIRSNKVLIDNTTMVTNGFPSIVTSSRDCSFINNVLNSTNGLAMSFNDCEEVRMHGNNLYDTAVRLTGEETENWNTHTISDTNSVDGEPVIYVKDDTLSTLDEDCGQLILANCTSTTVKDMSFGDVPYAVQIGFSTMVTLMNLSFEGSKNCIELQDSLSCTIADSDFANGTRGIYLKRSDWNWITNCTLKQFMDGVSLEDSDNNTIMSVDISVGEATHSSGVLISATEGGETSNDNLVQDCHFLGLEQAVQIRSSSGNTVSSSEIEECYRGIYLMLSTLDGKNIENSILKCSLKNITTTAVHADNCLTLDIEDTLIENTERALNIENTNGLVLDGLKATGIYQLPGPFVNISMTGSAVIRDCIFDTHYFDLRLTDVSNLTFNDNIISSEVVEFRFEGPVEDIVLYNNIFNSTSGSLFSGSTEDARWNISKTPGQNIIGGDLIGGNYWSDYEGVDTDGDGIGDSQVPHGPGDHLPLQYDLVPPVIEDVTEGHPTTGDIFEVRARPVDERLEVFPYLEYWFGDDTAHVNESMIVCDPWGLDIEIPSDSLVPLHYIASVRDSGGNWASTPVITKNVNDNDAPVLEGLFGPEENKVSTAVELTFLVSDNIGVANISLIYTDVPGSVHNISLSPGDNFASIPPQPRAGDITYRLFATDAAGNVMVSEKRNISIIDDIPPELEIISPDEGEHIGGIVNIILNASDLHSGPVSVDGVLVHREMQANISIFADMTVNGLSSFVWDSGEVDDGPYLLLLNASDGSGNFATGSVGLFIDNTPPVADAGPDIAIEIGDTVVLDGSASSGDPILFTWSFMEEGIPVSLEGMTASFTPTTYGPYNIELNVTDAAGNFDTDIMNVTVSPPRPLPGVVSTSVEDGAENVDPDTLIIIEFSEPMDRGSVARSLSISPLESYQLRWSADDRELIIDPTEGLRGGTTYSLTLDSPGSSAGMVLFPPVFTLTFTTAERIQRYVTITSPSEGERVKASSIIFVTGTADGFEEGAEVLVTFGNRTFTGSLSNEGTFEIEVLAPDEPGTLAISVSVGDSQAYVNVNVYQKEPEQEDDLLMYMGLFLIVLALLLGAFVWIRAGKKQTYLEE